MMDIQILELLEGARYAAGLTAVIDVFRAFSLEAWLFARGAGQIFAVGSEETARRMKSVNPDALLIGERGGKILPGFDYGNSPFQTAPERRDSLPRPVLPACSPPRLLQHRLQPGTFQGSSRTRSLWSSWGFQANPARRKTCSAPGISNRCWKERRLT